MTTQHTPTPYGQGCAQASCFIYGRLAPSENENEVIARCNSPVTAAFIVRACNAHDALAVALERLVKAIRHVNTNLDFSGELEQAGAALALARGKEVAQ